MNNTLKIILLLIIGQSVHISFAHVYVEGYVGGMVGHSKISSLTTHDTYAIQDLTAVFDTPSKKLSPSATGGFKIGWWPHHRENVADKNRCTAWWEHFGCSLDTRFNRLDYAHHAYSTDVLYSRDSVEAMGETDIYLSSKGPSVTLAFLLAFRYGFCATDKIPFGRLQAYVGFGPAGLFLRQQTRLVVSPHEVDGSNLAVFLKNTYTIAPVRTHYKSAPCLAFDTGMRFLTTRHIFLDCFFNYRYAPLRISYASPQLSMKLHYHLCSFTMGAGYEF